MLSLEHFILPLMSLIHCTADNRTGNEDICNAAADDDKDIYIVSYIYIATLTIMTIYDNEGDEGNDIWNENDITKMTVKKLTKT